MTSKKWKIVPVEATEEMEDAGEGFCDHDGPCFCAEKTYAAMLSAAPEPDEELVERVAQAMSDDFVNWENGLGGFRKQLWLRRASKAVKEIGRQTDD